MTFDMLVLTKGVQNFPINLICNFERFFSDKQKIVQFRPKIESSLFFAHLMFEKFQTLT